MGNRSSKSNEVTKEEKKQVNLVKYDVDLSSQVEFVKFISFYLRSIDKINQLPHEIENLLFKFFCLVKYLNVRFIPENQPCYDVGIVQINQTKTNTCFL